MQFNGSGGGGTYSWSASSLPAWLTIGSGGLLAGTPPNAGNVTFSVTLTDSFAHTTNRTFTLAVDAAITITNTSLLPPATVGTAYPQQFSGVGGLWRL